MASWRAGYGEAVRDAPSHSGGEGDYLDSSITGSGYQGSHLNPEDIMSLSHTTGVMLEML